MIRRQRLFALLLFFQAVLFLLYYYTAAESVIPGDMLHWKILETRVHTSSSPIEFEEADNGHNESRGIDTRTSEGMTNSSEEDPEEEEVLSPLEKFDTYARNIPNETVAKEKFLADQAAVQAIPTEAPGWVFNKTAADLFRKGIVSDSRFVNGNFVVTQGLAENVGLMPHTQITKIFDVPKKFLQELPKESPFKTRHFNTCSVVGNGGILKGSSCGKEIDASEFVFRINMAPMGDNYMMDIGNKTNLITMNPSMIKYRYTNKKQKLLNVKALMHDLSVYGDSYLLIWALLSGHNTRRPGNVLQALKENNATNQVIIPFPYVTTSMTSFWKENGLEAQRPSTGLILVGLATQICEEVRLYGFWPFHADRSNRRLTEHYYDNSLPTQVHSVPDEFRQLQRLHNTGVLCLTTHACQ
ncbi:ST8SIA6 [Branchiostoma lanceolatum]|uniref:ST8SIA6 protein n=1 Tax=Branchiostoma lanceolatum TaxID=7740 RepID=A0A8J9Z0E7_BRALA|nr:ST8SIA6 [Branchiostoma lanceolatum]